MKRLIGLIIALSGCCGLATAADYGGKVGKLEAVFSLDWKDDGTVSGSYSYPSRKGVIHGLRGNNPAEGELYLEEYTAGKLTARCYLNKTVTNGAIVWRGEMHNLDGRKFPMEFARGREAIPSPVPAPVAAGAGATRYSGHIGRLAAEYSLTWHEDGSVIGSYSYPDRPGTTYRLDGLNPREGELYLAEFTGEKLTARCQLWKRFEAGEIVWEGEMKNTDGRRFPMTLRRVREGVQVAHTVDERAAKRTEMLSVLPSDYFWNDFPLANTVVEMVPVHSEGGEHFAGLVTDFESTGTGVRITFVVGEWDDQGNTRFDDGPRVTLHLARALPLDPRVIIGKEIYLHLGNDSSLLSVELCSIAVTHVRKSTGGKFEIRGLIEAWNHGETMDWDPERFRLEMSKAPVLEFLPDKLALDLHPDFASDELFFQSIRFVKDYGITIQATDAGSGSLELESLSLDAETENPWIPLDATAPRIKAPPAQYTGQAG